MARNQDFTLNIKALFDASDVKNKVNDLQSAFKNIKLPDNLQKSFNKNINDLIKSVNDFESKAGKGIQNKTDANSITKAIDNVIKDFTKVEDVIVKIQSEINSSTDLSKIIKLDDSKLQKIQQLKKDIKELQQQISDVTTGKLDKIAAELDNIKSKGAKAGTQKAIELFNNGEIEEAIQLLEKVKQKQQQIADGKYSEKAKETAKNNVDALNSLIETFSNAQAEVKDLTDEVNNKTKEMGKIAQDGYKEIIDGANKAGHSLHETGEGAKEARDGIVDAAEGAAQFNSEVDQIKSRIQYFFGLNNAINLVKRTLREAYNTIKELDKAMTETAVVTNFSVGDMWAQLPDYTKRANELGVTTKAAYEAATLYYQQGLKTNEVMAMSNETLKMARIAGLDAAVATDRMTNAIRGFNMEINTMNAQRIDDVYSKLAAISASNVDEISTAMTKVASLAHNANMEFETTAAFLAQIIETTRESAETAGTALKTVVARFSEVKKLVNEGELKGNDDEGELIDVNKVSQALRTAGIDLNRYFLGEVGLDDIFMELASKWNSLTTMQQRYIATQAAGSRQQSRFIALMSDYARTQELVGEAYKANGAAAKQFAKTQESLESKLARLKNAWNEFAMGVLNSDLVKIGVDLLTNILNGINALTSGFGTLDKGIGGVINSVSKLILLFGGLGFGKTLLSGLSASISNIGLAAVGKTPLDVTTRMATTAVGANATGALAGLAGRGKGGALLAGFLNPFTGIGNVAKAGWAGAKDLGAYLWKPGIMGGATALKGAGAGLTGTAGLAAGAAGIGTIVAALGAVAAAAGVAYIAIKKLYDASPTGQVKIAEKYAESMQQAADTAKQTAVDFEKVQQEYNTLNSAVSSASNLEERTEAIKSRSEYVKSLIEQNSVYAQYLQDTKFENGEFYLTLDSKKLEEACNNIAKAAVEAAAANNLAQSNLAYQEYEKYLAQFELLQHQKSFVQNDVDFTDEQKAELWTDIDEQRLIDLQTRMQEKLAESTNYAKQAASSYINTSELSDMAASYLVSAIGEGLSSDAVSKKIKEAQKEISGDIDEQYYIAFGNLGEGLTKETKKLALAVKNANLSLVEEFKPFISSFEQLPEEAQKVLYEISSNNGYGLTRDEYFEATRMSPEQWFKYINPEGEEIDVLSLLPEEISKEILNAFKAGLNQENPFVTLSKSISEIFQDQSITGFGNFFNEIAGKLTAEEASVFPRLFKEFMTYGQGSIEDFTTFLTGLISSVPKNKLNDLFNLLGSLNFQDSGTLKVFLESLEDLNPDWDAMGHSAESAAEALKKFTNSVEEFNIDSFREEIVDNVSLMRDIKDRKSGSAGYRVFNQDEHDLLLQSGISEDQFVFSGIKNKEYTYTGESLDYLVEILVDGLTQKVIEAETTLDDKIAQGQWMANLGQPIIDELTKIINSGELTQEQVNNADWIEQIITKFRGEEALALPPDQLLEILKQAFQWYRDLEANTTAKETIQTQASQPMNYITPINEFKPEISDEEYSTAVTSKFYVDEHAEDRYEDILKSLEQINKAGVKWGETAQDIETISRALSVNWSEQASKLTELTEVLDKNDKILYESSKDSYEYSSAIHAVGEAMRAAYGEQISDEFVQAHIQQIVMARESKEAYQELLDILQQDFFSNAKSNLDEFGYMLAAIQQQMIEDGLTAESLNGLEINGVAVLDDTPWMSVIEQLIKAGYDVAAFFDTLGWTVTYGPTDKNGIPTSVQLVRNQPTGYGGYQPYTGSNWGRGSSGGGGSSKEKEPTKEEWRSDFDWLYNLMEDIAELQREQNKLQEEQNKILELANKDDTGKDLYDNLVKQMANLLTQKTYQSSVAGHRRQEMQEFIAANAGYNQYFRFNDKDQTLEINWDAINNIGDKETYEKVKDLVSEAEAIQKKMDESDDAVRDIEAQIRQLENIWREQFVDFEKRVLDALVKSYQRTIDNYSDLNDTVTRTNNDILTALQEEVALERQIRDNTKTEEAISDAEARLAFLKRDTTGGNQAQILAAQKQLDEQRREYEESLVDQSISRLQEDNEKAAEQREKQIELMQAQLNYAVENGEFNSDVYNLISEALGANGELLTNSDLFDLLQREESWAAMSATSKEVWEDELNNTFKEVSAYLLKEQGEADGSYLQAVASEINDGVWASANIVGGSLEVGLDSMGQSIGWAIGSMSQAIDHIVYSYDNAVNALSNANSQLAASNANSQNSTNQGRHSYLHDEYQYQQGLGIQTYGGSGYTVVDQNGKPVSTTHQGGNYNQVLEDLKKLRGYKTGGLTTKTGLAWLDGTTSEPEYVLNARQTDAFLKLAEVLPSMFNGASTTTSNIGGNMYLEFHVNVDSISNDYDVDQLVERVKDDIYSAASYRNANVINFSR